MPIYFPLQLDSRLVTTPLPSTQIFMVISPAGYVCSRVAATTMILPL